MSARKPLRFTAERFAELLEPRVRGRVALARPSTVRLRRQRALVLGLELKTRRQTLDEEAPKGRVMIFVDGERYDLRQIRDELGEAIDAILKSCPCKADDDGTDDHEVGSGKLANVIRAASQAAKLSFGELTVLRPERDPYRIDTPKGHRMAQWFEEWFSQLYSTTAIVHLRGFHYVLISHGEVVKPDGARYENTDKDFTWLIEKAAKAARWLGYVGFDRIKDERNDAPVILRHRELRTPTTRVFANLASAGDENSSVAQARRPGNHFRLPAVGVARRLWRRAALLLRVLRREIEP